MARPNLRDLGAVLGAVKAKPCGRPWRADLDRACARRMSREQAGTKERKRELREAARQFTDDALKTLAAICIEGKSEAARISAACALLDRGFGKPTQQLETESPGEFSHLTDEELEAFIAEGVELIATDKANGRATRS